jgi:basic amino acid/polyamine antiporter, APA family
MNEKEPVALRRSLSLPLITFYGLGTILGAGIYVLVGKVAGLAGMHAPFAFALAGAVAALSAFSYAELSSRMPLSGGEAVYVQEALGLPWLSTLVGCLIVLTGVVSASAIANGFVGYLDVFIRLPHAAVIALTVLALGALAGWGILQSVTVAALVTLVEVGGLLLIISVSGGELLTLPQRLPELLPPADAMAWHGIALGAFLAFYAFIGFEDMVNVAEEVKEPERNMPRAILLALVLSTLLYLLVAAVAVLSLPLDALAASSAPLADIYAGVTGSPPTLITLISLFAVINGALIQMIMASRMLYGMSRAGWLPAMFARLNARTRTPLAATAAVTAAVLVFALILLLVTLAQMTSFIVLIVFVLVNLSLIRIKRRSPAAAAGVKTYPIWVPWGGLLLSLLLLGFQAYESLRGA